jgi:hypothetical protein
MMVEKGGVEMKDPSSIGGLDRWFKVNKKP